VSITSELPPALAGFAAEFNQSLDPHPVDPEPAEEEVAGPVDPALPARFRWQQWDTGYKTGEVKYSAQQLGLPEAGPVRSIAITAHEDGTYYVSASLNLNLLLFRGDATEEDWEHWLRSNERQIRTFFKERYGANLNVDEPINPKDRRARGWRDVDAFTGAPVSRSKLTPAEAHMIVIRHTSIAHLHDDAFVTGGLGKLIREHVASTVVINDERALSLSFVQGLSDRDQVIKAVQRYVDAEIRERAGVRNISDSAAVALCRTLDERLYPDLTRFAAIGMGDKQALMAEVTRAAAFTRDVRGLARLEELSAYFLRGGD
jgi:hypothetical protein